MTANMSGNDTSSAPTCESVIPTAAGGSALLITSLVILLILRCLKRTKFAGQYIGQRYGLIMPFPLLEASIHRSMVVAVFAMASFNVADALKLVNSDSITITLSVSFLTVLVICLIFLPILSCIAANAKLVKLIGAAYTSGLTVVLLLMRTPTCVDVGPDTILVAFITYVIILPSGVHLVIDFVSTLAKPGSWFSPLDKQEPTNDEKYVRCLLTPENKNDEEPTEQNCCKRFVSYSSVQGFQFSSTLLVSVTVGITTISILLTFYLGSLTKFYIGVNQGLDLNSTVIQKIESIIGVDVMPTLIQQIKVVYGACVAALLVTFIVTAINVFQIMKSYQHNTLRIARSQDTKLLSTEDMKPCDIVVAAIQYGGFQVAHFVWGFHVQGLVLLILIIGVVELGVLLFTYGLWRILLNMADFALPIVLLVGLTIYIQIFLVKRYFLQNEGKELAIANRRGFYLVMYFMFFYNALRGMVTCAIRIFVSIFLAGWFFSRLDMSIFPQRFEHLDRGFLAYSSLLRLEEVQNNMIVTSFLKIVKRSVEDRKKFPYGTGCQHAFRRARKRWFLTWTLIHNTSLKADRRNTGPPPKKEMIVFPPGSQDLSINSQEADQSIVNFG